MKLNKLLSVLLAAAVLVCAVPMLAMADATVLVPDTPQVVIPGIETATLSFTPPTSGLYECVAAPADPDFPASADVTLTDSAQMERYAIAGDSNINETDVGLWAYYLNAGEAYTLTVRDVRTSTAGVSVTMRSVADASAMTLDTPITAVPGDYFTYLTFTPAVTDEYVFSSDAVTDADPYLRNIWYEDGFSPDWIEGGPDDENDWDFFVAYKLEAGTTYTLALYDYDAAADGFTVTVSKHYRFTKQPTVADPTVKVNRPEDTTYQWYTVKTKTVPVTEENIGMNWGGVYDAATGTWSATALDNGDGGYRYNLFTLPLKAGDVVTVTSSDTLDPEQSKLAFYMLVESEKKDGALVFTITEDSEYEVFMVTDADDSTFTLQVTTNVINSAVSGQTAPTLTAFEKNAIYACMATHTNGMKLTSQFVKMVPTITKQPTAAEPSVEVLFEDDVKSYQWHTVDADLQPVTDEMVDRVWSDVVFADGAWTSTNPVSVMGGWWGHLLCSVPLQAGDILTVICDDALKAEMSYVSGQSMGTAEVKQQGNVLTFTVSDDDIYDIAIVSDSDNSTFAIAIGEYVLGDKIDGQTTDTLTDFEKDEWYACVITCTDGTVLTSNFVEMVPAIVQQPTAAKPTVKVNIAEGASYQWQVQKTKVITADAAKAYEYDGSKAAYVPADGVWTATADSYGDYGYFVIDAKAGDIVKVRLADELGDGYIGLEDVENGLCYGDQDGADKDGFYVMTIEEDGTYYLFVSIDTKVKAEMEHYEAIDGQTADTLKAYEADQTYRCVITYEGGEKLVTDSFTVTQAAIDQAAADEVAALINALPETITKADAEAIAAAKKAYDALADNVKALIAEAVKAKLNAAIAAIEVLNQTVAVPEQPTDEPTDIPPTGEHSVVWLWAVLVLMSGCAVILTKRKARN